jgi:hypothetical protein
VADSGKTGGDQLFDAVFRNRLVVIPRRDRNKNSLSHLRLAFS